MQSKLLSQDLTDVEAVLALKLVGATFVSDPSWPRSGGHAPICFMEMLACV